MPSNFSLGACATIFSSILMSLSLPLHLSSSPPPYNHTQSSHHDHSLRKSRQCQDLLIPLTPSVLIHIPNPTSYNLRSAHRRKRNAQSIPMVNIVHHRAVRQSTIMMRFDAVRNGTLPLSALYENFDYCDIVDMIVLPSFSSHCISSSSDTIIVIQNQGFWCSDSKVVPQIDYSSLALVHVILFSLDEYDLDQDNPDSITLCAAGDIGFDERTSRPYLSLGLAIFAYKARARPTQLHSGVVAGRQPVVSRSDGALLQGIPKHEPAPVLLLSTIIILALANSNNQVVRFRIRR
ncbi:hypothetical protein F4604DRAFT_1680360 [Suillus subluteus]|nr:hypothetical protein F4604DRAFT_1680360 [Suillus subluteus]